MRLTQLMRERGLSGRLLAKKSGVPQQLISSYQRAGAQAKLPSVKNLMALAKALHVTPNDLLGWPADSPIPEEAIRLSHAVQDLPKSDPRRKIIMILLGLEEIPDQEKIDK